MCGDRRAPQDRTRGIALLWTLVAVVLVAGSSLALVRVAVEEKIRRDLQRDAALAEDVGVAAEEPILEWLRTRAQGLVLPTNATMPAAPVLHQRWQAGGHEMELRITAFDEDGMLPPRFVEVGSPLRAFVPADARHAVEQSRLTDLGKDIAVGLDLFNAPTTSGLAVFPLRWDTTVRASFTPDGSIEVASPATPWSIPTEEIPLGGRIATHNEGRLHVDTAPMALLEAVYRLTGRGGLERIADARLRGEPVTVVPPPGDASSAEALPTLVIASDAFAFRVDVRVNRVRPSWWMVYRRGGERGWTCVQRLVVP